MQLKIISFKDKAPKRGNVICFSEVNSEADFFFIDGKGYVWTNILGDCEFACLVDDLQSYGTYSHWARSNKVFNIDFDIPEE